jgi:anti-sigma factor RsiW
MRCDHVAKALPEIVEGNGEASPQVHAHVESCLRCQAELAQYRKLLRALRQLRAEVFQPAPGAIPAVLASLVEAGERRAVRSLRNGRRAAYLGGIAVATAAAGAAGAIVVANRGRRKVRLAG